MAQLLDTALSFAPGSPTYGSNFLLYLGVEPNGAAYRFGKLCTPFTQPIATAVGALASTSPVGFMHRDVTAADCKVTVSFQLFTAGFGGGVPRPADCVEFGVLARIAGGTLTDDGSVDVRYIDCDCYGLRLVVNGSNEMVFTLDRWNSGTKTQLATETVGTSAATDIAAWFLPVTLSLEVEANGSNVDLTAKIVGMWFAIGQQFAFGGDYTLFSGTVTDSSGSKLTTAGRCGFTMGRDRQVNGRNIADIIPAWEIEEGGSVVLRDEWQRVNRDACLQSSTAAYTVNFTGGSVASRLYFDQFVESGSSVLAVNDTGRLKLDGPGASSTQVAVLLDQVPAASMIQQRRTVDVEFGSSGTDSAGYIKRHGVVVRASYGPLSTADFSNFTGYAGVVQNDASGISAYIIRYVAGTNVTIASASGISFAEGTPREIDLSIYPEPTDPNPNEAAAVMVLKVGGVTVSLTAAAVAGVTDNGAGIITDASAARIKTGPAVGMYTLLTNTTKDVWLDDFDSAATSGTDLLIEDMATIAVNDEGTASVDISDTLQHAFPFDIRKRYEVISTELASGHRKTQPKFTDARRLFTFRGVHFDETDKDALETFFDARDGIEGAFYFTPDVATGQVPVHFVEDSLEIVKLAEGIYSATFQLEELLP